MEVLTALKAQRGLGGLGRGMITFSDAGVVPISNMKVASDLMNGVLRGGGAQNPFIRRHVAGAPGWRESRGFLVWVVCAGEEVSGAGFTLCGGRCVGRGFSSRVHFSLMVPPRARGMRRDSSERMVRCFWGVQVRTLPLPVLSVRSGTIVVVDLPRWSFATR